MNKIIITKQEIKEAKLKAQELSKDYDCYYYYRKRDEIYDSILQQKSNNKDISFDLNGGDLMYGERIPNKNPKTRKLIYREDGFTKEEYCHLTGEPVPNQWYDHLINVDEETGKVHWFEQNGNISIQMGASLFSNKYKHLVQRVYTKCNIVVEIV